MISGSVWMMPASGSSSIASGEADDAFAGHQAVGVEHQHVIVGAAPARDEIGDVAGLAVMVLRPVAVVDAGVGAEPLAPGEEGALLGDPGVGIGRIRQRRNSRNARRARSPRSLRASPRAPRRCARSTRCRPASRRRCASAASPAAAAGAADRRKSETKPRSALVKASAIQEKFTVNKHEQDATAARWCG